MDHLRGVNGRHSIRIQPDDQGFLGRQCRAEDCPIRYFKITPGTGIQEEAPCHCPYCGHSDEHSEFATSEQVEHALSVVKHRITGAVINELDSKMLRRRKMSAGGASIEISWKVEGQPSPILHYSESDLETEVICDSCGLRYAIYGVFAFCPDCGSHNSLQILDRNLDLAMRKLAIAQDLDEELAEAVVADALQTAVSAFDAFGRAACRAVSRLSLDPQQAESMSFQNLAGAHKRCVELFGLDLAALVDGADWVSLIRSFQKRHLFAHKQGVVDERYVEETGDHTVSVGRKVRISPREVTSMVDALRTLGDGMTKHLAKLGGQVDEAE